MIAQLRGTVLESTPLQVVLEVSGVGYELQIPLTTAEQVPSVGQEFSLFCKAVYREDSATLYGFAAREDRDFFCLMIEKVSGIGPRIALGMLSRMSPEQLRNAIASADITLLAKCPGIGKKTAERLVVELKDKVGLISTGSPLHGPGVLPKAPDHIQDAIHSLITLGYKASDADKLIRKSIDQLEPGASTEALIRAALSS